MKKLISILLVLVLVFSLSANVFAEEICRSTQSLEIDGTLVDCNAYNIDGYNYFRLRDLAFLLAGTPCCFNVTYDEATDTVTLTTGEAYMEGNQEIDSAMIPQYFTPSVQKLIVDGKVIEEMSAYNIDGSNYFKLAELKSFLGFGLSYNETTRTVKITTDVQTVNAADYSEVFAAITAAGGSKTSPARGGAAVNTTTGAEAAAEVPAPASSSDAKAESEEYGGGSDDYSGTNVQVEGIDEGDIVKTDGNYIYVIRDGEELLILKADGTNTSILSHTGIGWHQYSEDADKNHFWSESKSANEMFVFDGKICVISSFNSYVEDYIDNTWSYDSDNYTSVDIYDVSNPASPILLESFGQDGYSRETRMVDGKVYVASTFWVWNGEEDDPSTYVPILYAGGLEKVISADRIYISPYCSSSEYLVLCSYDICEAKMDASVSLLGGCDELYMNSDSIYAFSSQRKDEVTSEYRESVYTVTERYISSETAISRFDVKDDLKLSATAMVPGYMDSQFSADEYNGYLRIVTTSNDSTYRIFEDKDYGFVNYQWDNDTMSNGLYILDEALNVVGKIDQIAEDERIYSARFDGDIVYFCTYRNVDPLFAADISDPTTPKILSALKISGFSEYLHSWGGDRLFGFGNETNEETGWNEGLKLVMFNTSDKTDIYVENYLVLDAWYSEALYNHKAFFIDYNKNLIGFLGEDDYYIFSYEPEEGFKQLSHFYFDTYEWNVRGLWIDHWAYIVGREQAMIIDMNTWADPVQLRLSR